MHPHFTRSRAVLESGSRATIPTAFESPACAGATQRHNSVRGLVVVWGRLPATELLEAVNVARVAVASPPAKRQVSK